MKAMVSGHELSTRIKRSLLFSHTERRHATLHPVTPLMPLPQGSYLLPDRTTPLPDHFSITPEHIEKRLKELLRETGAAAVFKDFQKIAWKQAKIQEGSVHFPETGLSLGYITLEHAYSDALVDHISYTSSPTHKLVRYKEGKKQTAITLQTAYDWRTNAAYLQVIDVPLPWVEDPEPFKFMQAVDYTQATYLPGTPPTSPIPPFYLHASGGITPAQLLMSTTNDPEGVERYVADCLRMAYEYRGEKKLQPHQLDEEGRKHIALRQQQGWEVAVPKTRSELRIQAKSAARRQHAQADTQEQSIVSALSSKDNAPTKPYPLQTRMQILLQTHIPFFRRNHKPLFTR